MDLIRESQQKKKSSIPRTVKDNSSVVFNSTLKTAPAVTSLAQEQSIQSGNDYYKDIELLKLRLSNVDLRIENMDVRIKLLESIEPTNSKAFEEKLESMRLQVAEIKDLVTNKESLKRNRDAMTADLTDLEENAGEDIGPTLKQNKRTSPSEVAEGRLEEAQTNKPTTRSQKKK